MPDSDELYGIYEIAEMAGVTRAAVANWRKRFRDFPVPVKELRSGPVFDRGQVRHWLARRRGGVPNVLSMLNISRTAGVSTVTVALAEVLAADFRKRVLVIDLDAQMGCTRRLLGHDQWKKVNGRGRTIVRLFEDALSGVSPRKRAKPASLIVRGASPVADARTLDLLPSSLDLLDVQDRFGRGPTGPLHTVDPTAILRNALGELLEDYEYVLIDCPRDLGLVTLNGLRLSNGYIVPATPDPIATYGIGRIVERAAAFVQQTRGTAEPLGIVVHRFDASAPAHVKARKRLMRGSIRVFDAAIPLDPPGGGGAEVEAAPTMAERYGDGPRYATWLELADEIQEALEPTSKQAPVPAEEPPEPARDEEPPDPDDDTP